MSPLSNTNNNNNNNSSSLTSSSSSANNTSSSAFKPLSENRPLNMLTSSSVASANPVDPYGSDLSAYGSAYHHHHHLNTQLSSSDYLNVHHQSLPLGVYKSDHDDLQSGYSFARPVKLYEHNAASVASSSATACGGNIGFQDANFLTLRLSFMFLEHGNEEGFEMSNILLTDVCLWFIRVFCCEYRLVGSYRNNQFRLFVIEFECISRWCTVTRRIDNRFIDIECNIATKWRWRSWIHKQLVLRWPTVWSITAIGIESTLFKSTDAQSTGPNVGLECWSHHVSINYEIFPNLKEKN